MARRILGLDLGSHSVKAVELHQTLREVKVAQLRELPLPAESPERAEEIAAFLRMHALPVDHAVVALPGERVSTHRLRFPFSEPRKIGPAVPFEVEAQVPFDLDDFFVEWELAGASDGETHVLAVLARRAHVETVLESARACGVDPRTIEAEGPVLANLASLYELEGVQLILDLGHRKTTLCLSVDGHPAAARTVPIAGAAIAKALGEERGLGEGEAERVLREEGVLGGGGRPESAAALTVLTRLSHEILRTIGSAEALLEGRGAPTVALCGGTAHLHQLDAFLADRTGLEVAPLRPVGGELGASLVACGDPLRFAPALALALRASSQARTSTNLRKDDLAHRVDLRSVGREFRSTALLALGAMLLAVAGTTTHIVLSNQRGAAIEREASGLYEQAFPGRAAPSNVLSAMQQAVGEAQDRADTLGVYRGNLSALDVLTEISARVPAGLEVVFEEVAIDRQVVQIKGHSPGFGSVDQLRAELAKFAPFSQITVGDITRDTRRGGQTFNMRISLQLGGESS